MTSAGSWIALAFVPSALLVSVTAHISNDVAAAPLLWVVPLGLYLLTFVITFKVRSDERQNVFENTLALWQPWLSAAILMVTCIGMFSWMALGLVSHLALFVVNALVCHAALYRLRPPPQHLTIFYAAMSFGGALGGAFASLAAPVLFASVVEYPLLLAAALFCRPGALRELRGLPRIGWIRILLPAVALVLAALALPQYVSSEIAYKMMAGAIGALLLFNWRHAGRFALFGLAAIAGILLLQAFTPGRESFRSFFGVHRVDDARDGTFRILSHGKTIHGAIRLRNDDGTPVVGRPVPATYYAPNGPLGEAVATARLAHGRLDHASFIGLGTGALACHMQPGEAVSFFEIDPLVVWLARDSGRFRYLSACTPQAQFVIGDARLTLARQPRRSDVIVVDAFSSDAIPTHLLTREAFALYLDRLTPAGVIAVHISNNTMDFAGLIGRVATDLGLFAYVRRDMMITSDDPEFRSASIAVVVVRDRAHLNGLLERNPAWQPIKPDSQSWLWTDDYSTVLTAMWAKLRLGAANAEFSNNCQK